jgi:hypothetical protein
MSENNIITYYSLLITFHASRNTAHLANRKEFLKHLVKEYDTTDLIDGSLRSKLLSLRTHGQNNI